MPSNVTSLPGQNILRDSAQLSQWLRRQSQQPGVVLLETAAERSTWRDCCLALADKVLLLVDCHASATLPIAFDSAAYAKSELVIYHRDAQAKARKTTTLLERFKGEHLQPLRHHHVRHNNPADIRRLARDLTGQSTAVVLGGGSARSFVHIGVLRAMETLGIEVDRIGGTSMGAIVGAQYAAGYCPDDLLNLNHETWVRGKPHKSFTLPMTSLLSARRAKHLTQAVFEDQHIEDLWLDFFCVSSDLTHLKAHIHERGLIWSALLASGAIPGVCSSIVSEHGAVLVDGGVLDNLPVSPMQARNNGQVIAVDVTSTRGLRANVNDVVPPNGLKALWDYINPFAKDRRYPHTLKLLSHTSVLAAKVNAQASRQLADLCLTPDCHQYKAMDMRNLHALADLGYEQAMPRLEAWLSQR